MEPLKPGRQPVGASSGSRAILQILWLALFSWGAALATTSSDAFQECFDRLQADALIKSSAECFQSVEASRAEIQAALQEAVGRYPRSGWLHFILGSFLWGEETPGHYDRALQAFQRSGDQEGLYKTHLNYALNLVVKRLPGAGRHIEAIRNQVGASPLNQAQYHYVDSAYLFVEGELDAAGRAIARAYEVLPDEAPDNLRVQILIHQARVNRRLDLPRQALRATQQALAIVEDRWRHYGGRSSLADMASSAYDLAVIRMVAYPPSPRQRTALIADLEKALSWAVESENRDIEIKALRLLAEIRSDAGSLERVQRCLRLSRQLKDSEGERRCLLTWASLVAEDDPKRALELVEEAYAGQRRPSDVGLALDGWRARMQVVWQTRPPAEALQASLPFLDAVETLRRNQSPGIRDRVLSHYSEAYYWIAGRLLKEDSLPDSEARAFAIMERLRAQSLREKLLRPAARRAALSQDPRLQELSRNLEEGFRSLLDPGLDASRRAGLSARLDHIKNQLDERREALGPDEPPQLNPLPPDLLTRLQQRLAPEEALLSFQIGLDQGYDGRFGGGAWTFSVTRDQLRAFPLEWDQTRLEGALEMILDAPDEGRDEFFSTLYRQLLEPVLSELPPQVEKLILVLDGGLHRVPFARLRGSPDDPRLAERYQLARAPSAALLMRWREESAQDPPAPDEQEAAGVLVLADPLLPGGDENGGSRGLDGPVRPLGPLPFARREGERVLGRVGNRGRLLAGPEASEGRLKESASQPFQVLHLAAHAVVDESRPWRSAVLLAADADEDGWLRPEEIAALDGLQGQLVVLAACQGAFGEILRGEGVLSLARSFFAGGARSVIGSLEPLDDRQSMLFFDDYYRHLAAGKSVGQALADTQREWLSRRPQDPTWSSIVLLGEPAWTPFPGGIPSSGLPGLYPAAVAAAALLLTALLIALYLRVGKTRSPA